jgi:hypothetical protein
MQQEEKDICDYLKSMRGQYVSGKEIARRAGGKRRFRQDPTWATPFLLELVDRKIVESDSTGHFRLVNKDEEARSARRKWVSPQMKSILEKGGIELTIEIADEEKKTDA